RSVLRAGGEAARLRCMEGQRSRSRQIQAAADRGEVARNYVGGAAAHGGLSRRRPVRTAAADCRVETAREIVYAAAHKCIIAGSARQRTGAYGTRPCGIASSAADGGSLSGRDILIAAADCRGDTLGQIVEAAGDKGIITSIPAQRT